MKDTNSTVSCGRPANVRVPYRGHSNRPGRCRVLRATGHETMPYFPGRWFAKRDDDEENGLFQASMLALLKPWRSLQNLKQPGQTFHDAFNEFVSTAARESLTIIENIQFFHECADSARKDRTIGNCLDEPLPPTLTLDNEEDQSVLLLSEEQTTDVLDSLVTDDNVD